MEPWNHENDSSAALAAAGTQIPRINIEWLSKHALCDIRKRAYYTAAIVPTRVPSMVRVGVRKYTYMCSLYIVLSIWKRYVVYVYYYGSYPAVVYVRGLDPGGGELTWHFRLQLPSVNFITAAGNYLVFPVAGSRHSILTFDITQQ